MSDSSVGEAKSRPHRDGRVVPRVVDRPVRVPGHRGPKRGNPARFAVLLLSSTFENWQSEFLQLIWRAAGLMLLYFWGSSQSREGEERVEAKVDALLEDRGIEPARFVQEMRARADGKFVTPAAYVDRRS